MARASRTTIAESTVFEKLFHEDHPTWVAGGACLALALHRLGAQNRARAECSDQDENRRDGAEPEKFTTGPGEHAEQRRMHGTTPNEAENLDLPVFERV